MINWLRIKLQKFLGIDLLRRGHDELVERFNRLENKFNSIQDKLNTAVRTNQEVLDKNDYIMSYFNVSADIYPAQRGENWAVISVQGKPEYVRFINLSNRDIREISMFLKKFEGTNRTIDAPYGMDLFKIF